MALAQILPQEKKKKKATKRALIRKAKGELQEVISGYVFEKSINLDKI